MPDISEEVVREIWLPGTPHLQAGIYSTSSGGMLLRIERPQHLKVLVAAA